MAEELKKKVELPPSYGQVEEETEARYSSVPIQAVNFRDTWSVWESLKFDPRDKSSQSAAFIDNNFALFDFNNMEGLAKIWRTKIGNVSSLLSLDGKMVKFRDSNGRFRMIEAICLFKKNIQPAWEDKQNKHGGEFQALLEPNEYKPEVIDRIFKEITITILSDKYPFQKETNGIRLVDKSRGKMKIRLEIWTNFNDKSPNAPQDIKEMSQIFGDILSQNGFNVNLEFKNHNH